MTRSTIVEMEVMNEVAVKMKIQQLSRNQLNHLGHQNAVIMNSDVTPAFVFRDVMFAMDLLIAEEVKRF